MAKIDYRHSARRHVDEAKFQLSKESEASVRFACLELRMAIEALTYDMLQTYLAEVPNSAMAHWQPKRVIDELLAIDPYADQSLKLFVGKQAAQGEPSEKEEMDFLGEDRRFTVKWANKMHNALGNFLHEPMIAQYEKGIGPLEATARTKAAEIITELDHILDANLFNVNFDVSVSFDCKCGFRIKRKVQSIKKGNPVICADCGRGYCSEELPGAEFRFWSDDADFKCEKCGSGQSINKHLLPKRPKIRCSACGAVAQVVEGYNLEYQE